MVEMATEEGDADSLAESEKELAKIKKAVEALEVRTLLSGEYDAREALVTIRAGAGGVDAADFAEMLMRMYTRWAERNKYPVEVFDTSYAEEAGIKSATFAVHAPYAYGTLSVEAGTHRLVRISPFDNQGRRQTGFAAVEVVPVLEQTDEIDIPDEDVRDRRLPLVRSGRPVGQHHRLGRPTHPHSDRHGRELPEREEPAAEQGQRDGDPQGEAARDEEGRGDRPPRRDQAATSPHRGATRCATTCCTPTSRSRTSAPSTPPATPRPSSTVTSTDSSRPASAGAEAAALTRAAAN